jgi:L-malate glycosyltransferase
METYDLDKSSSQMSKTNVLLLLDSFDTGGAERQMLVLARLLQKSGRYGVHLACLTRTGELLKEAEQLRVGEIPEFPLTSFYDWNMVVQLRRFAAFLRERRISVVHTDGFYTNVFGMLGARLARVPARVGARVETGGWHSRTKHFIERSAFRLASVVHANSEAVKRVLVRDGVPVRKIAVVYYGLEMSRVTPPAGLTRAEALAIFGMPVEANRQLVTIIANMRHKVKDYPMFLRAAHRVREAVPAAMFALAGEGEMTDELRALARSMGLERDAFFLGRCDRIAELLFASDVCVLSSKAEGFSNSILEYMGAGRPVVATDVGGAAEVIIEGETGHVVASGDDETMAARIIALLRDEERARAMGERGRQIIKAMFSCEAQLEATERVYAQLLRSRQSNRRDKSDGPIPDFETIR